MRDDRHRDFVDVFGADEILHRRNNASACVTFINAIDARGLAPSCTPGAVRVRGDEFDDVMFDFVADANCFERLRAVACISSMCAHGSIVSSG